MHAVWLARNTDSVFWKTNQMLLTGVLAAAQVPAGQSSCESAARRRHGETFRLIERSLCKAFQKSSRITLAHQWLRFARSPAFKCSESAGSLRCRMFVAPRERSRFCLEACWWRARLGPGMVTDQPFFEKKQVLLPSGTAGS